MILLEDIVLHIAIQSIPKVFVLKGTARLPPSCASAHLTALVSLPLLGRYQVVNSEIPVKQRVREFRYTFSASGNDRGSFFRVLQLDREPETSGNLRVYQEYREKLASKEKRREGHSRRFRLTWLSAEVR